MIGRKKLGQRYITIAEAKEILLKRHEEGLKAGIEEPLYYEARLALEHAEKFAKLPAEKARDAVEELMNTFEWMNDWLAAKIVDIMPEDTFDLRVIFAKEEYQPTQDEMKKIIEILDKYRG
ncbi:DNA-directed RNA polymerase subunit F [Thermococcus chitonophagus]|uniref:DNA-directed RNA polymerase subunit Rpo4 n=1 Tax=Thermococcus chitonophagus TaxID=54262 RepID=A0A160VT40_9EURY|nr:RNA polymerase Rpb4 family protein [Thermococcus chitonophagus]ASJ16774.1 DNA-directed RNA polymerase subunit F [Thermococcus chitonophagus]CUX78245.1 DNA-directed RNA polymerase subunit F [Thermococcus chitonophagus]